MIFAAAGDKVQNCPTGESNAFDPDKNADCLTTLPQVTAGTSELKTALSIIFGIAIAIALVSLAIAAFNFVTSPTDSEKVSRAKKAIVFALVGLVISLSAEAIVLTFIKNI